MVPVKYVKQGTWIEIKKEIWEASLTGQPVCQFCRTAGADQFHHGVFPKGQTNFKKYRKWLDNKYNGIELCNPCHDNLPANARGLSHEINCARYGLEYISWYNSIPMRVKEDYDEFENQGAPTVRPPGNGQARTGGHDHP